MRSKERERENRSESLETEHKLALMMVSQRAAWATLATLAVLGRHSITLLNAAVGHSTLLLFLLLLL